MTQIEKQRAAMEHADDDVIGQLERYAWLEYARPRFVVGGKQEREARAAFIVRVERMHDALRIPARRAGAKLDFSILRLRYCAVRAIEGACPYCVELLGLENFGAVYDKPPGRTGSANYGRANVVLCCETCARAKGTLSGSEWLNVLEALRAAEASAAREVVEALIAGREGGDRRRAARYFRGPAVRG